MNNHAHVGLNPNWQHLTREHHPHLIQQLAFDVASMKFLRETVTVTDVSISSMIPFLPKQPSSHAHTGRQHGREVLGASPALITSWNYVYFQSLVYLRQADLSVHGHTSKQPTSLPPLSILSLMSTIINTLPH